MKKMNIVGLLLVSCLSTTLYPSQRPSRPTTPAPTSAKKLEALITPKGVDYFMGMLSVCDNNNPLVSWEIEHNNQKNACLLPNLLAKALNGDNKTYEYFKKQIRTIYNKMVMHRLSGEQGITEIQDVLYELWNERSGD